MLKIPSPWPPENRGRQTGKNVSIPTTKRCQLRFPRLGLTQLLSALFLLNVLPICPGLSLSSGATAVTQTPPTWWPHIHLCPFSRVANVTYFNKCLCWLIYNGEYSFFVTIMVKSNTHWHWRTWMQIHNQKTAQWLQKKAKVKTPPQKEKIAFSPSVIKCLLQNLKIYNTWK